MSVVKLSKKQRRLQKNLDKRENLDNEFKILLALNDEIILRSNKITMLLKEMHKIYPYEIRSIQRQTEIKLENLIKSGTKISKHKFDKPMKLSDDLYSFLNMEISDENLMTRIDVVGKISKYIRDKKLQNPSNRKLFNLDDNLKELFNINCGKVNESESESESSYTYNNINKFIQHHLISQ
uniref:DM2 domain-containing protein n=1 Tax=viral metagenome TaxID=1070528 RepID=A0A6C0B4J4_9ZZZZ